jgi:hypothetical protein
MSKTFSRRSVLAGVAAVPSLAGRVAAQSPEAQLSAEQTRAALKDSKGTKLVLLGTGAGPLPGRSRHMTSHVIFSNGAAYIIDCGLGVTEQFAYTGMDQWLPFSSCSRTKPQRKSLAQG